MARRVHRTLAMQRDGEGRGLGLARWIGVLAGLVALAAIVVAVFGGGEGRRAVAVAERAQPAWLALAVLLQVGTYACEAGVWWTVLRRAGVLVRFPRLYALSLVALFTNQALPIAGLAGIVVVVDALVREGAGRPVAVAAVLVDEFGFLASYALAVLTALAVLAWRSALTPAVVVPAAVALTVGVALGTGVLWVVRPGRALPAFVAARPRLVRVVQPLLEAESGLVRDPGLLARSTAFRGSNFLFDGLTFWACLVAVGQHASLPSAGVAFVVASLGRSLGVIPGGIGTFEGSALAGLLLVGIPTGPGLAATLLFRALSFWLPMLPGLWLAQRHRRARTRAAVPALPAEVAPWSSPPERVVAELGTRPAGLGEDEARARLVAPPRPPSARRSLGRILAAQFLNPLVLVLLAAAAISFPVGSVTDGAVILGIVLLSGGLGFVQEYHAAETVARLLGRLRATATVRRDGREREVPVDEVVPGDVVLLSAGATVPGDGRVLAANGLQVDESALTGESFPAEKRVEAVPEGVRLAERASAVFRGTHVVSGTAEVVIVATGADTELGRLRGRLEHRRPPTEFDLGLQRFGNLLVRVSAVLVILIFLVNLVLARPLLDAFLFSVALAVGLVPELLPAIVTLNLARGARHMSRDGVVVKRLAAIEDLGAVDVLCADKTGTLTEGRVRLQAALDVDGGTSPRALRLAWLNAAFESGYANPIDAALREATDGDRDGCARIGEVPYDFQRKRLTVVLDEGGQRLAITKGQLGSVLSACGEAELPDGTRVPIDEVRERVLALHARLAEGGARTLGVAWRRPSVEEPIAPGLECDLVLAGLLAFADPPKADAREVLQRLEGLGISLVVVTGDDRRVAAKVWRELRGREPVVLGASELKALGTEALERRAPGVDVFAEVEPVQKERIVHALRRAGHVVAYLGDGINDAPALRAADVGLTVDGAADVAREAADVVLRQPDLGVLADGVREGRRTLANSLKYVFYTTSANFGNMLSMAAASAFLPFLPLLPKQILLGNFLSDLPAMAIAADRVDEEQLARPGRWRTADVRSFMVVFGTLSSVFDLLTFAVLLAIAGDTPVFFRTGWFLESLLTELLVLFVMRTRRPMFSSRPAAGIVWLTVLVVAIAFVLPFSPLGPLFGLEPLPGGLLAVVTLITVLYVAATEVAKHLFFRRVRRT